jgi:hypothetical protein
MFMTHRQQRQQQLENHAKLFATTMTSTKINDCKDEIVIDDGYAIINNNDNQGCRLLALGSWLLALGSWLLALGS